MNQPSKTTPKDFFLHLLSIVTLYYSAVSFTVLLFQYVNVLLPDVLEGGGNFRNSGAFQLIRWQIASLIVVFPTYVITSWHLTKLYTREPEKRNLRVRKWLVYFTLFVAALIIIGDLVTLVYNLLGGETTVRFLLKVAAVLFVAGSVFGYYFTDLRRHRTE